MSSALESAMELIEMVYVKEGEQILGVYDAPLRIKQDDSVPVSPLAVTIAEQIKVQKDVLDALILSIRVNPVDDDEEVKVREIKDDEECFIM